jgi:tetratricopeptide (TPR) repeat protein
MKSRHISPQRRRAMEAQAQRVRVRGQMAGSVRDEIVDEILREIPDVSRLEAHRYAYGWSRVQLSYALDLLYESDGLHRPQVTASEICGWEHGRHTPNPERQDYLARVYRTRPDRVGFGRDYTPGPPERATGAGQPATVSRPAASLPAIASGLGIVAGPGDRILSMRCVEAQPGTPELIVEVEDCDMDRRTMIKLIGGLAAAGLTVPQVDLERLAWSRAVPGGAGPALVGDLRAVAAALRSQRLRFAPTVLLRPALAHLDHLSRLLRETPGAAARELGRLTGETALLTGWVYRSLSELDLSRAHYAHAKRLAREFDDPVLRSLTLVTESELHSRITHGTSPADTVAALRLLDEASAPGGVLPAMLRARLAAQQAEEHAILGSPDSSERALERARQAVAEQPSGGEVAFLGDSGWAHAGVARLAVYEGTCRLLLGEPARAAADLRRALAGLDPAAAGTVLAVRIDLGAAHVAQGDVATGVRILGEAYDEALATHRLATSRRAVQARDRLASWSAEPAFEELGHLAV